MLYLWKDRRSSVEAGSVSLVEASALDQATLTSSRSPPPFGTPFVNLLAGIVLRYWI